MSCISQIGSQRSWQPRNANKNRPKPPQKPVLSSQRIRKRQPRKTNLLDNNLSTPAKYPRKEKRVTKWQQGAPMNTHTQDGVREGQVVTHNLHHCQLIMSPQPTVSERTISGARTPPYPAVNRTPSTTTGCQQRPRGEPGFLPSPDCNQEGPPSPASMVSEKDI